MNLSQLRYFVEVAKSGSATAAAKALYTAQPTISTQIKRLERELGCSLFARTGRNLALTPSGRKFLPYAENILNSVSAAEEVMDARTSMENGSLSFGYLGTAHRYLIAEVAGRLNAKFPNTRMDFRGQNSAQVAELVREGACDAGLVMLPIDDRQLSVSEPVSVQEHYYWTAARERVVPRIDLAEISRRRIVLGDASYRDVDPLRRQLSFAMQDRGLDFLPFIEVELLESALEIAARGIADIIATELSVKAQGVEDVLFRVPIEDPTHESLAVVKRSELWGHRAIDEFEVAVREAFAAQSIANSYGTNKK
ncbi:LysR family transcriptional regulator [Arthrobacter sp. 18067]|uniref:LysR family transcriptional regulator n=1 Tax=Arthrobacter sp. 18067 TaxID=2681413 RepID=UPI00135C0CDF|nr:LysR family transcriptional regulator [Arthrobacter sp. 18067]